MPDLPFELDAWQSICPHCAAVVAALDHHITHAHPATSRDVAPETPEAEEAER